MLMAVAGAVALATGPASRSYDQTFVRSAYAGTLMMVRGAKLVRLKSSDRHVRAYADTVVADYGGASSDLLRIARDTGMDITAPSAPDDDFGELARASGAAIGPAYYRRTKADFHWIIGLLRGEIAHGRVGALRDFAGRQLALAHRDARLARGRLTSTLGKT